MNIGEKYMLDLLQKEHQAQPLTPVERATLKLFWSAVLSGLIVGGEAAVNMLESLNGAPIHWTNIIRDAIILALFTAAHTILGYFKANKDVSIEAAAIFGDGQLSQIEKSLFVQDARGVVQKETIPPAPLLFPAQ